MEQIILTSKEDLQEILRSTLIEIEQENRKKMTPKLYTINEIRLKLGRAHATIARLVKNGSIKTTADGLITEQAINDYLKPN